MKSKKFQDNGMCGLVPESGAIFMSDCTTLEECFERRLFGLPSTYADFVREVKAGMILFLFEYENRKLYGVFEASCDGGMNIVPNAFGSSGRTYPAQVLVFVFKINKILRSFMQCSCNGRNGFHERMDIISCAPILVI